MIGGAPERGGGPVADLADLVIKLIGYDLNAEVGDASTFRLTATNERAAAVLRMLLDHDRELATGRDGHKFTLRFLAPKALERIIWRAELAGLTVQLPESRGSS
jgi:hypothetical protein